MERVNESSRVRLSLWAPQCLPGFHLPYFAALADGVFASYGLDVTLLDPLPGPANVARVAAGAADFCLTNINYYMAALTYDDRLAAKFAAILQQRSTLAAIVPANSPITRRTELAGARVAGVPAELATCSFFNVPEFFGEVAALGVRGPTYVRVASAVDARVALLRGDCDATIALVDQVPVLSRYAGAALRAVPLDLEIYANGLVAGNHVSSEVVERMVAAVSVALQQQRAAPDSGLPDMLARYPTICADDTRESWRVGQPYHFIDGGPCQMHWVRWQQTLAFVASTHRFSAVGPDRVCRDTVGLHAVNETIARPSLAAVGL